MTDEAPTVCGNAVAIFLRAAGDSNKWFDEYGARIRRLQCLDA